MLLRTICLSQPTSLAFTVTTAPGKLDSANRFVVQQQCFVDMWVKV